MRSTDCCYCCWGILFIWLCSCDIHVSMPADERVYISILPALVWTGCIATLDFQVNDLIIHIITSSYIHNYTGIIIILSNFTLVGHFVTGNGMVILHNRSQVAIQHVPPQMLPNSCWPLLSCCLAVVVCQLMLSIFMELHVSSVCPLCDFAVENAFHFIAVCPRFDLDCETFL